MAQADASFRFLNERKKMAKNHRPDRMAGEIRKIIGELLVNGVKDPRITDNFVNVTDVEVTSDGSFAYVYLTALSFTNDPEAKAAQEEDVLAGLKKQARKGSAYGNRKHSAYGSSRRS